MSMKETLFQLTNALGGSGREHAVSELVRELIGAYVDHVEINDYGCVLAYKYGKPSAKTILLDAHIDQMSMVTTGVTSNGFLRFLAGGIDPRQVYGADVLIETRHHGFVPGVVCTVPYFYNAVDYLKTVKVRELAIDIGYPPEKVKEMVSVGDYIYYANETVELTDGIICGRAMDDRAGAAILIEMAKRISKVELSVNVVFSFTTREETGGPGAALTGYLVKPDLAIAIDGTHAKCWQNGGPATYNFGDGAIIGYGDHAYPAICNAMVAVAKKYNIPYVMNLISAHSSTNAGRLEKAALGIPSLVVEFPMRYAHSSVEIIELNNLCTVTDLLTKFVQTGGSVT